MYNTTDIEIIKINPHTKKCVVKDPLDKKEFLTIIFSRDDYHIIFIYIDNEIKSIMVPQIVVNSQFDMIEDLVHVHPAIPIFYYENFDIESFVKGMIFTMAVGKGEW